MRSCSTKFLLVLVIALWPRALHAESLMLDQYRHVTFKKIVETKYSQDGNGLKAEVDGSSSFLLGAFSAPRTIKTLRWTWKFAGNLMVGSAAALAAKQGDDAMLRIGLIKEGNAPLVPFFAPSWTEAIRNHMKLPGDELTFFIAGGPAKPGAKWVSPYTNSMRLVQVESVLQPDGWMLVNHTMAVPIKTVGLWIMSDGDNSGSKFTIWLKDLTIGE